MKKAEIQIGRVYGVKVSGTVQPVRILNENRYGGWDAINTKTNRAVRIHTAAKCRFDWEHRLEALAKAKAARSARIARETQETQVTRPASSIDGATYIAGMMGQPEED